MKFDIFNTNKILAHHETIGKIVSGEPCFPVMVSIDASSICNQKCTWCSGTGYVNKTKMLLEDKIFKRLPLELSYLGVKAVLFSGGGEPLLNDYVPSAAQDFASRGIEVGLITNGTMITKETAGILAETCKFIRVSIDAVNPDTYMASHKGSVELPQIVKSVEELVKNKKNGCQIGTSFIVNSQNYMEIRDFVHQYSEIGVDYVQFKPVVSKDNWLDRKPLYDDIISNLEKCQWMYGTKDFRVLSDFKRFRQVRSAYTRLYSKCLGHNLIGQILATGRMCICCQMRPNPELHFSQLRFSSFESVWNGPERAEAIKRIDLEKCPTCKFEAYNQMLWTMKHPPEHFNFL
jgi:sulfatase maturation enzyme AslB (radical SAM superfamily)